MWEKGTQLVEKECTIKYSVFIKHTALLYFSLPNMTFPSTLHLFFTFVGPGFEVFTVLRIHNAVWVRILSSLVHGYECFARVFCVCSQAVRRWRQYLLTETSIPTNQITWKVIIFNLNIVHFCTVYRLQTHWIHTWGNKYSIWLYIIFWFKQNYFRVNIM
jgi:hypothetical protein